MSDLPLLTSHKLQINLKKVYSLYAQLISHKNIHGGLEDSHIFDINHISSSCKSSLFGNMHIFCDICRIQEHILHMRSPEANKDNSAGYDWFTDCTTRYQSQLSIRQHSFKQVQTCASQIKPPSSTTQQCNVNKTHEWYNRGLQSSLATHYNIHMYPCHELPALASVYLHIIYLLEHCKRTANVRCVNELNSSG